MSTAKALRRLLGDAIHGDPLMRVQALCSATDKGAASIELLKDRSFSAALAASDAAVVDVIADELKQVASVRKAAVLDLVKRHRDEMRKAQKHRQDEGESNTGERISDRLIVIGESLGELFRDEMSTPFCAINGHGVTAVNSEAFSGHLVERYYRETASAPATEAIKSAKRVLAAKAKFDGELHPLATRLAGNGRKAWIDLCDAGSRAVKVTPGAWEVVANPPLLFIRHDHQLPLPEPVRDGDPMQLLDFVNIQTKGDQLLFLVWMVLAYLTHFPVYLLVFHGAQGSAKTSSARMGRALLDPSATDTQRLPRQPVELAQILDHTAVPLFDNVSGLTADQSDLLCMAVTGGSLSKRKLFTDAENIVFGFRRAMIMTGINIPATAPDLMERTLLIGLKRIAPEERKSETELLERFNALKPSIFGGLLDALAKTMRIRPTIKATQTGRMADWELWGAAAA